MLRPAGHSMRTLGQFRADKPGSYPDQTVYAEYACAELGPAFTELDGGSGLVFEVASKTRSIHFGAGRCSWYPQNSATAATLASDKYFTNLILERADIPTLGGEYFFLHERHRAHRVAGHEREDTSKYLKALGGTAFVKPLTGSRGDFAQAIGGDAALARYIEEVAKYYDAILIQPFVGGCEWRVFLLDGEVLYTARKYPPSITGDGARTIRDLLRTHDVELQSRGLSPANMSAHTDASLDPVLPKGARWEIPGRMNLGAGGRSGLEVLDSDAALALAKKAATALGLRVAAVDLFTGGDAEATRVIEVNSNPSIRLLENAGRADLILRIWRHTFSAMGLL